MARLTSRARKKLPAGDFAGPGRSYPIPDKAHAIAAKSMAARYATPSVQAKVDAKANRVIKGKRGYLASDAELWFVLGRTYQRCEHTQDLPADRRVDFDCVLAYLARSKHKLDRRMAELWHSDLLIS
jgi:hypothetical protein